MVRDAFSVRWHQPNRVAYGHARIVRSSAGPTSASMGHRWPVHHHRVGRPVGDGHIARPAIAQRPPIIAETVAAAPRIVGPRVAPPARHAPAHAHPGVPTERSVPPPGIVPAHAPPRLAPTRAPAHPWVAETGSPAMAHAPTRPAPSALPAHQAGIEAETSVVVVVRVVVGHIVVIAQPPSCVVFRGFPGVVEIFSPVRWGLGPWRHGRPLGREVVHIVAHVSRWSRTRTRTKAHGDHRRHHPAEVSHRVHVDGLLQCW
jgi:hypothetical protein